MDIVFLRWIEPTLCLIGAIIGFINPESFFESLFYTKLDLSLTSNPFLYDIIRYGAGLTGLFGVALHLLSLDKNRNRFKFFCSTVILLDVWVLYRTTILSILRGSTGFYFYFGSMIGILAFLARLYIVFFT